MAAAGGRNAGGLNQIPVLEIILFELIIRALESV
jgi:hypothetical protein